MLRRVELEKCFIQFYFSLLQDLVIYVPKILPACRKDDSRIQLGCNNVAKLSNAESFGIK